MLRRIALLSALLVLGCLGGLPDDFESLPMDEKIDAYAQHLKTAGTPLYDAQNSIARHGYPAAEEMAGFLEMQDPPLRKSEALEIIMRVQLFGCSLKGTVAETAVLSVLSRGELSELDRDLAESTLDFIRRDVKRSEGSDGRHQGPCGL